MASASAIPPRHVEASSLQEVVGMDNSLWPALNSEAEDQNDWEMIPPSAPQVKFHADVVEIENKEPRVNPKILKHAQSSPDLRSLRFSDKDDTDDESAFLVEDSSLEESSNITMISGPPSVWSVGSSKLSFRDVMLQRPNAEGEDNKTSEPKETDQRKTQKLKPKFVVKPITRCTRSMGNLRALDHIQEEHEDSEVLGETDASDFYNRKAHGALGRKNGLKIRPDEAKRLEITKNKKAMQRERQAQRG